MLIRILAVGAVALLAAACAVNLNPGQGRDTTATAALPIQYVYGVPQPDIGRCFPASYGGMEIFDDVNERQRRDALRTHGTDECLDDVDAELERVQGVPDWCAEYDLARIHSTRAQYPTLTEWETVKVLSNFCDRRT